MSLNFYHLYFVVSATEVQELSIREFMFIIFMTHTVRHNFLTTQSVSVSSAQFNNFLRFFKNFV